MKTIRQLFWMACLVAGTASASTTLTISTPGAVIPPTGAYVRSDLANCANPTLTNSNTQIPLSQRYYFNGSPSLTINAYDNVTQIACSGNLLSFYTFTYVANGVQTQIQNGIGVELPPGGPFALANLNGLTSVPFNAGVIQGPTGPPGPQGIAGPLGPAGTGGLPSGTAINQVQTRNSDGTQTIASAFTADTAGNIAQPASTVASLARVDYQSLTTGGLLPAFNAYSSLATLYTAFGDSITCGYTGGGSPPYGFGVGCTPANAYPSIISSFLGVPLLNYGIPGDQACDIWVRQMAPTLVKPSLYHASQAFYSVMIGTNDAAAKGAGAYEAVFSTCQKAVLTWLGIPAESKSLPATSTKTGGFTLNGAGPLPTLGDYDFGTSTGTAQYTISTNGGNIYIWHTLSSTATGSATYALDGTVVGTLNTLTAVPIATQNGTNTSVGVETIAGVSSGTHTVTVSWVSGGVAILGVGSAPQARYGRPVISVASVPYNNLSPTDRAAYTADSLANVKALQSDGIDARWANNAAYYTGAPGEVQPDGVHPTPFGALHLAQSMLSVMQPVPLTPLRPVSLVTSGNFTGGTTSGTYGGTVNGQIGGSLTPGAGNFAIPITASGSLTGLGMTIYALAPGGTFDVLIMTCSGCTATSGGTMTIVNRFTLTPQSTGVKKFVSGVDFSATSVTSGQYIGVYANGATIGFDVTAAGPGWYYINGTNPTSGQTWTYNPSYRADFAANVGGTVIAASPTVIPLPGMVPTGHCFDSLTNSLAQSAIRPYITKGVDQITVTTANISQLAYDIGCTTY